MFPNAELSPNYTTQREQRTIFAGVFPESVLCFAPSFLVNHEIQIEFAKVVIERAVEENDGDDGKVLTHSSAGMGIHIDGKIGISGGVRTKVKADRQI